MIKVLIYFTLTFFAHSKTLKSFKSQEKIHLAFILKVTVRENYKQ